MRAGHCCPALFLYRRSSPAPARQAGRAVWRVQAPCLRQGLASGGIHFPRTEMRSGGPPTASAVGEGTSPGRSPSSWASKLQRRNEGRTLLSGPFSVPAKFSCARPTGGPPPGAPSHRCGAPHLTKVLRQNEGRTLLSGPRAVEKPGSCVEHEPDLLTSLFLCV